MADVTVGVRGRVLEVVLKRGKVNAIDAATSRALGAAFRQLQEDDGLSVGIVTAEGRFFSAGWDLKAAAGGESPESDYGAGGFGGITELFDLKKPVICAMNGHAVGGGFELAMAADLLVVAETAEAWLPEVRLGILPDAGGVLRLPRLLPRALALEVLMAGRRLTAAEGLQHGLYNRVVPAGETLAAARALAEELLLAAPLSLAGLKEILNGTEDLSVAEATRKMRGQAFPTYRQALVSEDAQEGPRAFAEKRTPAWKGR